MEIRRLLWLLPLLVVGTLLELQSQLGHVVVDLLLLLHLVVDARIRVHHGGVVLAAEDQADVVEAHAMITNPILRTSLGGSILLKKSSTNAISVRAAVTTTLYMIEVPFGGSVYGR